jgi:hypothetical protein
MPAPKVSTAKLLRASQLLVQTDTTPTTGNLLAPSALLVCRALVDKTMTRPCVTMASTV